MNFFGQTPNQGFMNLYQTQQTPKPYYDVFQPIAGGNVYGSQPQPEEEVAEQIVAETVQQMKQEDPTRQPNEYEIAIEARRKANAKFRGQDDNFLSGVLDKLANVSIVAKVLQKLSGGSQAEQREKKLGTFTPEQHRMAAERGYASPIEMQEAEQMSIERDEWTRTLGIDPSEASYSAATGTFYDPSSGVAVDRNGFAALTSGGTHAYDSLDSWGKTLSAGNASGWRGGFMSEGRYLQLSPTGKENYNKFLAAYNEQNGTNYSVGGSEDAGYIQSAGASGRDSSGNLTYSGDHDWSQSTKTRNSGGIIALNYGGDATMNTLVSYRQVGGPMPADDGSDMPPPVIEEGMAPPAAPMGGGMPPAGGMPAPAPAAPVAPPAPVRKTFAEKVAEARASMKAGETSVPLAPLPTEAPMAEAGMMDGQGDGPVAFGEGAGHAVEGEVGPDIGPDDVDAMLPEGSYVLNAEATEMNGPEIDAMEAAAGPPMMNSGSPRMIRAKLTRGERTLAPHVVSMFRDRIEQMNQGGLAMRKGVEYHQDATEAVGEQAPTKWYQDDRLGQLGKSLVAIGQHDFAGASDALTPVVPETDEDADTTDADIKVLVKEAGGLIQGAAKAGDFINGHHQDLSSLSRRGPWLGRKAHWCC